MQSMSTNVNIGFFLIALTAFASTMAAATCESLTGLKVPNTTIVASRQVAAGSFTPPTRFQPPPPGAGLTAVPANDLPAFCAVSAVIRPAEDSEIGFELWMPVANWNRKFMGIGNGGFGGMIPYPAMSAPLARGYATASTDTGHPYTGQNTSSFALGHPEKVIDFGYRAVHEMTLKAKLILAAYYGEVPSFSYWYGCSQGGRQGLAEAQRFPADYNGIVVGAPAVHLTHLTAASIWRQRAIDPPGALVPPAKLALLHKAVLEACDAQDGVKDGIIEDPRRCEFDPAKLLCKQGEVATCLTAAQVEAVRQYYAPVVNPRTKQQIYPGLELGSESAWGAWGMNPNNPYGRGDYFKSAVFQDPNWDYRTFDFDSTMARADQIDNDLTKDTNPDVTALFGRGGKLLQFHGWSDPSIPPQVSIQYYVSVRDFEGGTSKLQTSARLFMIPGMGHCGGGDGPNQFDAIRAIEAWVEMGRAPERITASHLTDGKVDRTRPLCPYPQVAKYKGTGSTDDAASFVCTLPR